MRTNIAILKTERPNPHMFVVEAEAKVLIQFKNKKEMVDWELSDDKTAIGAIMDKETKWSHERDIAKKLLEREKAETDRMLVFIRNWAARNEWSSQDALNGREWGWHDLYYPLPWAGTPPSVREMKDYRKKHTWSETARFFDSMDKQGIIRWRTASRRRMYKFTIDEARYAASIREMERGRGEGPGNWANPYVGLGVEDDDPVWASLEEESEEVPPDEPSVPSEEGEAPETW